MIKRDEPLSFYFKYLFLDVDAHIKDMKVKHKGTLYICLECKQVSLDIHSFHTMNQMFIFIFQTKNV